MGQLGQLETLECSWGLNILGQATSFPRGGGCGGEWAGSRALAEVVWGCLCLGVPLTARASPPLPPQPQWAHLQSGGRTTLPGVLA